MAITRKQQRLNERAQTRGFRNYAEQRKFSRRIGSGGLTNRNFRDYRRTAGEATGGDTLNTNKRVVEGYISYVEEVRKLPGRKPNETSDAYGKRLTREEHQTFYSFLRVLGRVKSYGEYWRRYIGTQEVFD